MAVHHDLGRRDLRLPEALAIAFPGQIDPAWAEPIQQIVLLAASFVGDALAIFGRLKAKQPIG